MTTLNNTAARLPLKKIAKEMDKLSPEMRRLIAMALTGTSNETRICSAEEQTIARLRLNEAVTTWTEEAREAKKNAASAIRDFVEVSGRCP